MISEIKTIYHYCSIDAFLKILMSQSIFLTHCRMLNDRKEDRMFLDSINEEKFGKMYLNEELNIAKDIIKLYRQKVDFPYVACFSKQEDILSQWIAYGDDGRGISIGFDLSKIPFYDLMNEQYGENPRLLIDEMSYSDNDQELIEKIISVAIILYKREGNKSKSIRSAVAMLENMSIFTKSTYFSHEDEVRMVYQPCYRKILQGLNQEKFEKEDNFEIGFLTKNAGIKSYIKYSLPLGAIVSITLGPTNKIDYNQLTILLSQYAPRVRIENNIKKSKISYAAL